ncbi:DNA helicase RecQ [Bacteroidales bacterium OttesenSCG-928-B11]|nr:DNA helicase RecQ [Bacteroidales bacterium OttesenSCG-928-B11]MDL2325463.1 DNA helicase RecQ [Bacteroidales bacterium OttesenSCG-928-A14]
MQNYTTKDLQAMLKKFFGFNSFKGNQQKVIKALLKNKDCFVIMPTGGGKSLCYQLPALMLDGTAIIISPLIALMKNQVDAIRNFGTDIGIAHFLNSSLTKTEIKKVHEDLLSGKTKLLYVAPESLTKEENVDFFKTIDISFYAIDEAHCISEWGHDFRPEYRRIRSTVDMIGKNVPVMALTATATPKVQSDIQKNLGMDKAEVFISSFNRANLYYEIREKTKNVDKDIVKFIRENEGKSGIIYCLSRKKVEELASFLQVNKIKALPYHAGLDSQTRVANQDAFLMENANVIVATIAFGMGIDKPDVRFVIHYDMPKSLEGYYQETGRGGRDDGEGQCVAFYDYADLHKLEKFSNKKNVSEQEIVKQLLAETASYAESTSCRRKHLLSYFGENYEEENCNNCDNCNHPKPKMNASEYIQLALEVIQTVKQQFNEEHIIDILTGNKTTSIVKFKHNKLKQFGEGQEYDAKFWSNVIRLAIFEKLLVKDIENHSLVKITDKGKKYIDNPYTLQIVKPVKEDQDDDSEISDSIIPKGDAMDKTLFSLLKDLRKDISQKENLPPYIIFQDPSLEDMCIQYPTTLEEMTHISGVGTGKAQKYGKPFADLIKKYVIDNEIERPQDFVVKSVVKKSAIKVYIIQSIDRKLNFEDIAIAKGLGIDELLTEIENIVTSGTKLDIDYYIDEFIDPGHQDDILDYFAEAETDSFTDALEELGEDEYTLEEIRIMRIKYLSDVGN